MSSEGKRLKSINYRNLIDTSPLVSNFPQSWDRLPLELAIHIYNCLPMKEKYNMSLTCKFWLAAFRHPGTWRYSHFVFTGKRSLPIEIPDKVLSSLQYVTIDCSVRRYTVSYERIMERTIRLDTFVVALRKSMNTTLQELNILDMRVLNDNLTNSRLRHHLRKLLAKQTKLSRLSLVNGGFRTARGLKLLTAAGQNSAQCLKYLNVRNFSSGTSPPAPELTFARLCGTFTNLTELRLNCGFMSDDLLNNLSGTLKLIIVWANISDFDWPDFDHKYTDNGWNMLVSKCTGLKAEYHVELHDSDRDISLKWILLPAIPLATLHWWSVGGAHKRRIRRRFDRIINTFKSGLEHLHVDVGCTFLSEKDVVAVVESCPLLKTLYISRTPVPLNLMYQSRP